MKRMILIFIILAILSVILLLVYFRQTQWRTPPFGGIREDHTDPNAPKVIESADIVVFHCTFSTLTSPETKKLGRGIYELDAVLEENMVSGNYCVRLPGETGEEIHFETDASFLAALQELVENHDLARHNGLNIQVSGLPYFFGTRMQVEYASGESIHACHNQSSFLSMEEREALNELFCEQLEKSAKTGEHKQDK